MKLSKKVIILKEYTETEDEISYDVLALKANCSVSYVKKVLKENNLL